MKKIPIEKLDIELTDEAKNVRSFFKSRGYLLDLNFNNVLYELYQRYVIYIALEPDRDNFINTGQLFVEDDKLGRCEIVNSTLEYLVEHFLNMEGE